MKMKTYGRSSTVPRRRDRRLGSIVARLRGVTVCTKPVHRLVHGCFERRLWQAELTHRLLRRKVHGASRHTHASQWHEGRLPGEMRESFTDVPKRQGQTIGHAPARGGEAADCSR